jgi:hypothetical protein
MAVVGLSVLASGVAPWEVACAGVGSGSVGGCRCLRRERLRGRLRVLASGAAGRPFPPCPPDRPSGRSSPFYLRKWPTHHSRRCWRLRWRGRDRELQNSLSCRGTCAWARSSNASQGSSRRSSSEQRTHGDAPSKPEPLTKERARWGCESRRYRHRCACQVLLGFR